MSARVIGRISDVEPWGAPLADAPPAASVDAADLDMLAAMAATRAPVQCSSCQELIVHDGDLWRHVRTGLSADWRSKQCQPLCRDCGQPAQYAIGGDRFIGSGIRFVTDHFLCQACRNAGSFIERT